MRVLSVVHDDSPTGGGGLFERVVAERGDHLDRWFTANGDAPPDEPGAWDAIMVFGGVMHPDQDAEHEWLAGETAFIQSALGAGIPVMGVCLGAQLVARAAGARVGPARAPEVGWHEVELMDAAAEDPVLGVLPPRVTAFQWQWKFAYTDHNGANGQPISTLGTSDTIPLLVLPTGESIEFTQHSNDVIHSFWIPEFLFKRDVFRCRTSTTRTTAGRSTGSTGRARSSGAAPSCAAATTPR